ncbi:TniQ family protein [Peribacillus sp. YIM B13482]|uniref:TniQ family protein n=1 Tax=Peribacillus sp. YIM B13482 TaxID=3366298 RepID=UPI00366DEE77
MANENNLDILNELKEKESYSERSTLYGLEPIGKGTPFVESISSYICRLAYEHNVDVTTLLFQLVIPSLPEYSVLKNRHSIVKAHLFLGIGKTANNVVSALEILTHRNDLIQLTFLNWKPIVRVALINNMKKWCSECFNEMNERMEEFYEPLIWQLKDINYCLKHLVPLQKACLKCKKEIPHIRTRMKIGYCPFCNLFLGNNVDLQHRRWLRIIPRDEEKLLAGYSDLLKNNNPSVIPTFLFVRNFFVKIKEINPSLSLTHLSRVLSIKKEMLNEFFIGTKRPNMRFWTEISRYLEMPLHELLKPEFDNNVVRYLKELESNNLKRNFISEDEKLKMKMCMINHLEVGDLSINMHSLAVAHKFDQRKMRQHYPDLYNQIIHRYRDFKDQEKKQYYLNLTSKIRLILDDPNQEPISLKKMMGKFGTTEPTGKKYMPDLCEEIKHTYKEFLYKKNKENKKNQDEELKEIMYKLHKQGLYPNELIITDYHSNKSLFRTKYYRESRKRTLKDLGY